MISEHGGSSGVRAGGDDLIESALARPQNRYAYAEDVDLADLAAAYLFGLAKDHGFIDGNKRVAFSAAATFLLMNGMRLMAPEPEAYDAVINVVEGRWSEAATATWIRANTIN